MATDNEEKNHAQEFIVKAMLGGAGATAKDTYEHATGEPFDPAAVWDELTRTAALTTSRVIGTVANIREGIHDKILEVGHANSGHGLAESRKPKTPDERSH